MDWNTMHTHFDEEISDALKYKGMAEHMDGCDRQVLMDMAWEEYAHAKHLCRMMKEHGVDTASHEDTLRKVKETFLK